MSSRRISGRRSTSDGSTPYLVGTHHGLRFGVSGDSRGELGPFPSIRNVQDRGLDFFVMLGDSIYADVASDAVPHVAQTLQEFQAKHEEVLSNTLGLNAFGDARATTALFAVIDDHEVRNDFAGGAHPSSDTRFAFTTEQFINETPLFQAGLAAFHQYLDAEQMSVTWKFVMVPEPIENLGVLVASDLFEGYAAERTEILSFIEQQNIHNVVFVAADLHGTLVNNLTYETAPLGSKTPVDAFEIVTGPVAYDAPLGPTAVNDPTAHRDRLGHRAVHLG